MRLNQDSPDLSVGLIFRWVPLCLQLGCFFLHLATETTDAIMIGLAPQHQTFYFWKAFLLRMTSDRLVAWSLTSFHGGGNMVLYLQPTANEKSGAVGCLSSFRYPTLFFTLQCLLLNGMPNLFTRFHPV